MKHLGWSLSAVAVLASRWQQSTIEIDSSLGHYYSSPWKASFATTTEGRRGVMTKWLRVHKEKQPPRQEGQKWGWDWKE
jgi:hypothetical protein